MKKKSSLKFYERYILSKQLKCRLLRVLFGALRVIAYEMKIVKFVTV